MQITRYPSLSEMQFLGCTAAFADSLFGELNTAVIFLRKLEGQSKGAAFAFEMSLDAHRYGALMILERWQNLVGAFGDHVTLSRHPDVIAKAPERVRTAEEILRRANHVIDAASHYASEIVSAGVMAFQSLNLTFEEEKQAVEQTLRLGPMLPQEFHETRRIFAVDLAAR